MSIKRYFPLSIIAAVIVAAGILSASCFAQNLADYSKPASHFPSVVAPYIPRHVPEPNFANTSRIDPLLRNGKLMLSLSDTVAMALENNLDISIARYNLAIADTDLLRAKAGQSILGVATGLVQGTPGGGVGGFGAGAPGAGPGGTSGGAGGAGTGASGLVQSTLGIGPPIDSFDPQLNAGLNLEHVATPLSNTVTTGVSSLQQNTGTADFNYQQGFATGTLMSVDFNNSRLTDNTTESTLVPALQSNIRLTLRQHLLSGFGFGPNMRFIRIAKNNREISDIAFRGQIIATVSQIQNIYWDLVNSYEDVRVKERSLALAQKTLHDNQEQVKIGAMAPIEVTQAENEVATRNQDLIIAQTGLQLQQLLIKNAITRNLSDPLLASAEVIPTDTMYVPEEEPVTPIQDLITDAVAHRPELSQARIDLTNRQISRKSASNALLPTADFVTWYGTNALAGEQNPNNPGLLEPIPRSGFGNAFATLFRNDFPDYAVGFNISIPIRNRAAQADQIRSELEYRQAQTRLQQLQNEIVIEVRNAQFAVQQNRVRVMAATKSRDLAQHTFEIEQKKYVLGASTSYQVLQTQRDLAQAESTRVAAMSDYEKSRVELDRATGLTLARNGIELEDAERGQVQKAPQIPGVIPRKELPAGQPGAPVSPPSM